MMAASTRNPAALDAAVAAAEARMADLIAQHGRQIERLAGIRSNLEQARADAEKARGRRTLAALHMMLRG